MSRHCQSGQRSVLEGTRSVARKIPHVIGIAVALLSRIRTRLERCAMGLVVSMRVCHRRVRAGPALRARSRTRTIAMNRGISATIIPASHSSRSAERHSNDVLAADCCTGSRIATSRLELSIVESSAGRIGTAASGCGCGVW